MLVRNHLFRLFCCVNSFVDFFLLKSGIYSSGPSLSVHLRLVVPNPLQEHHIVCPGCDPNSHSVGSQKNCDVWGGSTWPPCTSECLRGHPGGLRKALLFFFLAKTTCAFLKPPGGLLRLEKWCAASLGLRTLPWMQGP